MPADTVGIVIRISSTIDGEKVNGEVAGGQLVGSPALVARVEELIAHGRDVGLGDMAGTRTLADNRLARFTLLAACDGDSSRLGGDPPRVDRIPVGAEA